MKEIFNLNKFPYTILAARDGVLCNQYEESHITIFHTNDITLTPFLMKSKRKG